MPKFFEKGGVTYMEVKPVKSMFQSDLITDVVNSGRKFIVNMNTGDLTIYNPAKLSETSKIAKHIHPVRYIDPLRTIELSKDLDVAIVEMADI